MNDPLVIDRVGDMVVYLQAVQPVSGYLRCQVVFIGGPAGTVFVPGEHATNLNGYASLASLAEYIETHSGRALRSLITTPWDTL